MTGKHLFPATQIITFARQITTFSCDSASLTMHREEPWCLRQAQINILKRGSMKVSVVGIGAVGTAIVASLAYMGEIQEIVAVNRNKDRADAEITDLRHTVSFNGARSLRLRSGDYDDVSGSRIVIIASGAQPRSGGTRDDVLKENCDMICDVIKRLERIVPEAIFLIITNPVDVVTQVALNCSHIPKQRLLSTGTVIDTARLMQIIGSHVGIDPKNVFGYVMGDHSPTGFVPWSIANICGVEVNTFCRTNGLPLIDKDKVLDKIRGVGTEIFIKKGNTNHGIAATICRIVRAIAIDEKAVLPVGTLLQGEYGIDNLVMSVPCIIGRSGMERIIHVDLTPSEQAQFSHSEQHVRELLATSGH
jgi:L-lactate dehydrogenase